MLYCKEHHGIVKKKTNLMIELQVLIFSTTPNCYRYVLVAEFETQTYQNTTNYEQ